MSVWTIEILLCITVEALGSLGKGISHTPFQRVEISIQPCSHLVAFLPKSLLLQAASNCLVEEKKKKMLKCRQNKSIWRKGESFPFLSTVPKFENKLALTNTLNKCENNGSCLRREGMVSIIFSCVFCFLCPASSSPTLNKLWEGLMESKEQIENEASVLRRVFTQLRFQSHEQLH